MRTVFAAALAAAAVTGIARGEERPAAIEAEGTQFRVTMSDGRVLRSPELVGIVLRLGEGEIRIDAVERDPADKSGAVWLHRIARRGQDGAWRDYCLEGPDGRRAGFPLAGVGREDGTLAADPKRFEIVCTAGARGKCVRLGYRLDAADTARAYAAFNACVRMVRADYCGTGASTTRDGMVIDVYDDLGVQRPDMDPAHRFEAGWRAEGAVCVHHPRVADALSLEALAKSCPRLAGKLGAACTEETARKAGAIVFNRSKP